MKDIQFTWKSYVPEGMKNEKYCHCVKGMSIELLGKANDI